MDNYEIGRLIGAMESELRTARANCVVSRPRAAQAHIEAVQSALKELQKQLQGQA